MPQAFADGAVISGDMLPPGRALKYVICPGVLEFSGDAQGFGLEGVSLCWPESCVNFHERELRFHDFMRKKHVCI